MDSVKITNEALEEHKVKAVPGHRYPHVLRIILFPKEHSLKLLQYDWIRVEANKV